MGIEALKVLVQPPKTPLETGGLQEWRAAEKRINLELPTDYRDFILAYGTGLFARFYGVYNPFSKNEYVNLELSLKRACDAQREIKAQFPNEVPYLIYPERPGLLPWGRDDNGNDYFWLTDGPPDSWKVVSCENRGEGFREYGRTMTEFLCEVLTRKIEALAGDYPTDEDRVFEPLTQ
jgi:hypothetical protein